MIPPDEHDAEPEGTAAGAGEGPEAGAAGDAAADPAADPAALPVESSGSRPRSAPLPSTKRREAAPPAPFEDGGEAPEPGEMSFLDHLEELRRRLFVVVLAVALGTGLGYVIAPQVFEVAIGRLPQTLEQGPLGGGLRAWVAKLTGDLIESEEEEEPSAADRAVADREDAQADREDAQADREDAQARDDAAARLDALLEAALQGDTGARRELPGAIAALARAEADAALRRARLDASPAADPPAELIVTTPAGAILTKLKVAVFVGIVLSVPVIVYQAWMFVVPGLVAKERRIATFLVVPTTLCFALGVYFSYRILPLITAFLSSVSAELGVEQRWIADDYLGFVLKLMLVGGVSFQLPVVSFGLASLGIIGPSTLRRHRRLAVVIILVAAATFTPPDPLSMIFMGLPLLLLYEISIGVAALARRRAQET